MRKFLKRYPKSFAEGLTLRPMEVRDQAALVEFFKRIPIEERRLFKDDVTDPNIVTGWLQNLNYENVFPLLAMQGDRIVADATLHRDRRGWSRHVGKIRVSVDPEFRRRGLGRKLIQEFIDLAKLLNIAIIDADVLSVQPGASKLFEELGFLTIASIPQHAIDLLGQVHDIIVYSYTVTPPEALAPEASLAEEDADIGGG